jgi:hypothetical protein
MSCAITSRAARPSIVTECEETSTSIRLPSRLTWVQLPACSAPLAGAAARLQFEALQLLAGGRMSRMVSCRNSASV